MAEAAVPQVNVQQVPLTVSQPLYAAQNAMPVVQTAVSPITVSQAIYPVSSPITVSQAIYPVSPAPMQNTMQMSPLRPTENRYTTEWLPSPKMVDVEGTYEVVALHSTKTSTEKDRPKMASYSIPRSDLEQREKRAHRDRAPAPARERSAPPERAAPVEIPTPMKVEKIIKVIVPVLKVVEEIVQVPVEKVVYREKPVDVQKIVVKEVVRRVDVPVEKMIEREVNEEKYVERIVQLPVEKIIEIPVEKTVHVPVERIIEVQKKVERLVEVPVQTTVQVPVERLRQVEKVVEVPVERGVQIPAERSRQVERQMYVEPQAQQLVGLGMLLEQNSLDPAIVVKEIIPGMAAYKSGQVRLGDILIALDGQLLTNRSLEDIKRMTFGPVGSQTLVEFIRDGRDRILVNLTRQ